MEETPNQTEPTTQTADPQNSEVVKKITKPIIYTEEFVKEELNKLLKEATDKVDITVIGELFEDKPYSQERFSEWAKGFKNNDEISQSIKKIKQIFENKVNVGGLKGKLNATMAIFNLKNNYGWKDKNETDITTGGDKMNPLLVKFLEKDDKPKDNGDTTGVQETV